MVHHLNHLIPESKKIGGKKKEKKIMLAYNFMKYEHENFHFLIKKKIPLSFSHQLWVPSKPVTSFVQTLLTGRVGLIQLYVTAIRWVKLFMYSLKPPTPQSLIVFSIYGIYNLFTSLSLCLSYTHTWGLRSRTFRLIQSLIKTGTSSFFTGFITLFVRAWSQFWEIIISF